MKKFSSKDILTKLNGSDVLAFQIQLLSMSHTKAYDDDVLLIVKAIDMRKQVAYEFLRPSLITIFLVLLNHSGNK